MANVKSMSRMKRVIIFFITFLIMNVVFFPNAIRSQSEIENNTLLYMKISFLGEERGDLSGSAVAGGGDVNGDGFDDFIISSPLYGKENSNGKVYLFFGKDKEWKIKNDLSNADASFIGPDLFNFNSHSISIIKDVNSDGYDEIFINGVDSSPISYLFFGKKSNWNISTNIEDADIKFIDDVGIRYGSGLASGIGDVNGDGFNDFLLVSTDFNQGAGKYFLFFGKSDGWKKEYNISECDASFVGEGIHAVSGKAISGAGDVNNDGYDDFLIGTKNNHENGNGSGKSYLILGKSSGWKLNLSLSEIDISFLGENAHDLSGTSISKAGDVNGDGYDDFLIGAYHNDEGGEDAGRTYLIFGKGCCWEKGMNLSKADVKFTGDSTYAFSGESIDGGGDINGDGYSDILIGAPEAYCGHGKSYVIFGRDFFKDDNYHLSDSNLIFYGEQTGDCFGQSVAFAGDINRDGYDEIIFGAYFNSEKDDKAGKVTIISPTLELIPSDPHSIKVYSDPGYLHETRYSSLFDTVFIEATYQDNNSSRIDLVLVNITSNISKPQGISLRLYETGPATGKFRGALEIMDRTNIQKRWIKSSVGEIVTIASLIDPKIKAEFEIIEGTLSLSPEILIRNVLEDTIYYDKFNVYNGYPIEWSFETDASWLNWYPINHSVIGIPRNADVGSYWVKISIKNNTGSMVFLNYSLIVVNAPPKISIPEINPIFEDQLLLLDFDSDDDPSGTISWSLHSKVPWLELNTTSGVILGTPSNDDVGSFWINISVDDGNGGSDNQELQLSVINVNDPPIIISSPILQGKVKNIYTYDVNASDEDVGDVLLYSLEEKPDGMEMNNTTGLIEWIPKGDQEGKHEILVTVSDSNVSMNQTFTISIRSRKITNSVLNGSLMVGIIIIILILALVFLYNGIRANKDEKIYLKKKKRRRKKSDRTQH